jgi:DNA repair protein RadC
VESAALFSLSILNRKTMKDKVNEIQISYKEKASTLKSPKIKSSKDTAELLFEHWNENTIGLQETFKVLLLNNSNKVKGVYELSNGGITGTMVDLRILFAVVIKSLSVGIILTHNHPSGKLKPSEADKNLTKRIKKAASYFDIMVLDHVIIAPNGEHYSFADNGLI